MKDEIIIILSIISFKFVFLIQSIIRRDHSLGS